mgnify:FL=1
MPPIAYETERTRIGLGGSLAHHELCPADLERLDHRVGFVEDRLGVRRHEPVTVYLLDAEGWGPPQCPDAMGCYFAAEDLAFTSYWFAVEHEMVHAVTRDIRFPSGFWREGTAEVLTGMLTRRDPGVVLRPRSLDADELGNYATAAHFCRFLIETRGWDKFARAIRGESLENVYGETAEALTDEYEREAPYSYPPLEPCAHPSLATLDGDAWADNLTLSCDDPAATGMNWSPRPEVRRIVDLEAGTYAFRFRGGVAYSLLGCHTDIVVEQPVAPSNGDLPNEVDYALYDGTEFGPNGLQVLELTQGRYRISAIGSFFAAFDADLSIRKVDWALDQDPPPARDPE